MKNKKINIPKHVGIIMDGNRRWARERNLKTFDGHKKGFDVAKQMPNWFFEKGVKIISLYAFSTENWKRESGEVNYLMKLFRGFLKDNLEELKEKKYKLLISGRIDALPGDLPELCLEAETQTKDNDLGILNLCLNYGGRAEIIDVIKKMIKKGVEVDQVHEGMIRKNLYHGELSDPDLIIRTSGEKRLSGFLTWQGIYSELIFLEKYWPDFEKRDVDLIIEEYSGRKRTFGEG
jgi:undecaprenyl diphosphate synthase